MYIKTIRARKLKLISKNDKWFILDIRTPDEFHEHRVINSKNIFIELFFLPKFLGVLKKIPVDKKILIITRNGKNYFRILKKFHENGFTNNYLLKGGFEKINMKNAYVR